MTINVASDRYPDLTLPEAMKILHIHRSTANRWIKIGKLPAQKVGVRYRIFKEDVDSLFEDVPANAQLSA
jgi:excisionase family DNA binding protein